MFRKKSITIWVIFIITIISCQNEQTGLLIEAESFKNKGGWVVDPQFVEQVGSPYLLAHGLGEPVEDAVTTTQLKKAGAYHIWVRTKDWSPGNWQSPGRFKLSINNIQLDTVFGTQPGWDWHYGGKVNLNKTEITLKLSDLTGFDGRCDAIFLSSEKTPPPNKPDELARWRKKQLMKNDSPEKKKAYDLVIVGGGIAGCAAAIASAEQGLNVALIHDRPVLGGNASGEIRVHTLGITWYYGRILRMLNTRHYPNGSPEALSDDKKRHQNMEKYNNIKLYLNWRAYNTNTINDSIISVDAKHISKGGRIRFHAPMFVDCTGDGWIGYWAGAAYMYGREDSSKYHEAWKEHGELWSPGEPDNRVMGASVLWRTKEVEEPYTFPEVPWALEVAGSHTAINGEWYWEYSSNEVHQINDAEAIRDHMLKAIYGSFYNAKTDTANANRKLEWVSYLLGKRESRRLIGDYIYTFNDVRNMKSFNDSVVKEKRAVDVHYQQNLLDPEKPDFYSEALFYRIDHYYIPYRCLYSKNIKNLFMAGRCFSCSHIGLGGPRVMNTTGQMGAAVGYAASLCKKYNKSPRGIYNDKIDELKDLVINSSELP